MVTKINLSQAPLARDRRIVSNEFREIGGRAGPRSLFRVTVLTLGAWRERYRLLRTGCGPELVSQDIKVPFESVVPEHLRVCQQHFNCQQLRGQQLRRWPCAIFHWSSLALVFRLLRLPGDPGASAKLLGHRGVNPLKLGPPDRVLRLILKQPAHSRSLSQKSWVIETSETASPCWPCCRVVHLPIPCAAYAPVLDTKYADGTLLEARTFR